MKRIFLLIIFSIQVTQANHVVTVMGTGYVGLVTGACIAEIGTSNQIKIICTDIDQQKIELLQKGIIPIYEANLEELITRNTQQGTLYFSTNVSQAIQESDIIFIAVGTPTLKNGDVDLSYFESAIHTIAQNLSTTKKTVVVKSTVPIGTCKNLYKIFASYRIPKESYTIIFNPEFLREGTAVDDFLNPDRIIAGIHNPTDAQIIQELYQSLLNKGIPLLCTDTTTAETIKYASNNFLALKLSFINEIANLCEATGADISKVSHGIGLDHRIGPGFLKAGPGFGGSCLPKDTKALLCMAQKIGIPLLTIEAARKANKYQKRLSFKKVDDHFQGNIAGKTIGILGLAYKAGTDDIRYSTAIPLIKRLLERGAYVKTYDPAAMENMQRLYPTAIYCQSSEEVMANIDALIVLTDWPEFKAISPDKIYNRMKQTYVIDTRNILPQFLEKHCVQTD